jgi:hypothetical protein
MPRRAEQRQLPGEAAATAAFTRQLTLLGSPGPVFSFLAPLPAAQLAGLKVVSIINFGGPGMTALAWAGSRDVRASR